MNRPGYAGDSWHGGSVADLDSAGRNRRRGARVGTTSDDARRIAEVERDYRELKRANEICGPRARFRGSGGPAAIIDYVDDYRYVWTLQGFATPRSVSTCSGLAGDVVEGGAAGHLGALEPCSPDGAPTLVSQRRVWVHRTDVGSRCRAIAFTAELREAGLVGSVGSVGDALDNANGIDCGTV